jgi:hypothetical protein
MIERPFHPERQPTRGPRRIVQQLPYQMVNHVIRQHDDGWYRWVELDLVQGWVEQWRTRAQGRKRTRRGRTER